jgi:hypothetical protein
MQSALALRLNRGSIARMVAAGSLWGLTLSAGFFVNAVLQCGMPCPDDIAVVTTICVGTGIFTIGPIAGFAGRPLRK